VRHSPWPVVVGASVLEVLGVRLVVRFRWEDLGRSTTRRLRICAGTVRRKCVCVCVCVCVRACVGGWVGACGCRRGKGFGGCD
jgi:hypothetical protein